MISRDTIQQITQRIDIVEIISEFVKLKKRGANYLGLCPFHNEKTPSFTVSPGKDLFKCFGCGKSGNAIGFLMEHEKYSYVEALKWLAVKYNIAVEETAVSDEFKQQQQTADSLYILNNFAQQTFSDQLWNSAEGQTIALSYLFEERGFQKALLEKFQIGYCPSAGTIFTDAALALQYNKELLIKSGLSAERTQGLVDNYRGRIIFPIHNNTGKIIGFGARVIGKSDKGPKYINTPENEIYIKSRILYGLYFARMAMDKANECFLVEGYTDVISLHQAGVENVVASGGTSLTTDQLRIIKKYTSNLTIIYDGDLAGIKAALRGLDMALEEGLNVQLALIPDGEDPDSYVKKYGGENFKEFVSKNKKDVVLFQLDVMLKDAGSSIQKKNEVINHIAETLSKINKAEDFLKQQEYIKQCAALLKIDEGGLTQLVNKYKRDALVKEEKKLPLEEANFLQDQAQPPAHLQESFIDQDDIQERNLLRVLLEHGLKIFNDSQTCADAIFEATEYFHIENPLYQKLFTIYKSAYEAGESPDIKTLMYHPEEDIKQLVIDLSMFPYELSQKWDEKLGVENAKDSVHKDTSLKDVILSINYFKLRKLKKMLEQNQRDLQMATEENFQQFILLHQQLKQFEKEITAALGTVILK